MDFTTVYQQVHEVPFIDEQNARFLYDLIIKEDVRDILELGIAHGTATCYMAAAVDQLGGGTITSVDLLEMAEHFQPSPEDQLASLGLAEYVKIVRMQTGYTWFLHDDLARNSRGRTCRPVYDLVIIDGPKNWTIDGAAFFMSEKLLRPGGWLIFDDMRWTYARADKRRRSTDGITHRSLSEEERNVPHVAEIFNLLVKQHPNFDTFFIHNDDWAVARKVRASQRRWPLRLPKLRRG